MIHFELKDGLIEMRFSYDPIIIDRIKSLPQRKYIEAGRYWVVPEREDSWQTLGELFRGQMVRAESLSH